MSDDDALDDGDPAASDDEAFPDPQPGASLVPGDAVAPLVNAAIFLVVWSGLLLYLGRSPLQAVGLGLVGATLYFVVAYYVL